MSWKDGDFSDELASIKLKDAIGLNIYCEDGIPRRCVEIVNSVRWPWKAIINEQDPESGGGYFVNILSLTAQILNKPLPDKDAMDAFEKMMRIKFSIKADGSFDRPPARGFRRTPNGLLIPN